MVCRKVDEILRNQNVRPPILETYSGNEEIIQIGEPQSYLDVDISNTRLFFACTNVLVKNKSLVWEMPTTRYDWDSDQTNIGMFLGIPTSE